MGNIYIYIYINIISQKVAICSLWTVCPCFKSGPVGNFFQQYSKFVLLCNHASGCLLLNIFNLGSQRKSKAFPKSESRESGRFPRH